MKPELTYRALMLYGKTFGVMEYSPDIVSYSFIPFFKRAGYVWIHASSVVRYCHLYQPEEFGYLNRFNLIQLGPHETMNNGRDTRSFRLVKIDRFEHITGIKV